VCVLYDVVLGIELAGLDQEEVGVCVCVSVMWCVSERERGVCVCLCLCCVGVVWVLCGCV